MARRAAELPQVLSGLWSGSPNVVKIDELDVICTVLSCGVEELLIPEPESVAEPRHHNDDETATVGQTMAVGQTRSVTPRTGAGRSLPPR
ncbi:helix-turn-helix domain-containing protein [Streptosporangium sp. NBC_01469]|uniref:helix-turn-helix domain-containing protein n=1 Tax=Streptosporangium sp. NBC_01469 TaxID=2903898 RepID=UPI003FCDC6EE